MLRVCKVTAAFLLLASPALGFVPSAASSTKLRQKSGVLQVQKEPDVDQHAEYQKHLMAMNGSQNDVKKDKPKMELEEEEEVAPPKEEAPKVEEKIEAKVEKEEVPSASEISEPDSLQAEMDEEFMGMAIDEAMSG